LNNGRCCYQKRGYREFVQAPDSPITKEGATLNENSPTMIPGANIYQPHQEVGVDHLTLEQEARRANAEAERQSTKKDNTHVQTN
jgi:hypothetical protein